MDAVPLIDAQTAAILGSVNKYTVQQHTKWWDNCIEAPNTYTIFNMETQQALIRVEEQSDGMDGLGWIGMDWEGLGGTAARGLNC